VKTYFTIVLVLNILFEGLAAAALIFAPEAALAPGDSVTWARNYGFAALAMASTGIWLWPYRSVLQAVTAMCGVLMVFHFGLCLSLFMAGGANIGAGGTHGILGVLFVVAFTQRRKWCLPQPATAR